MGLSVHQASRHLLREALLAAVDPGRGGGGIGSVSWRASAALYVLLGEHELDRRGRCRCCRGRLRGRGRRMCRVLVAARFSLHQPEELLLCRLASERHQPGAASRAVADREATEVLPRVGADPIDPGPRAHHTPDHGGAGEPIPRRPRPRRAPPDERPPAPGGDRSLVLTGGGAWQR